MKLKTVISILLFCIYLTNINTQNCIDYGEFDGPECVCAPNGWNSILGSEEIDDLSGYGPPCSIPESPTGGTAVAFDIIAGSEEGIYTTVMDLIPGQVYNLAFWWMSWECPPGRCCAMLSLTIDDEVYEFDPQGDWTLVEFCITAESETMELELTGISGGPQGKIFLDDVECDILEPCCDLETMLEEDAKVCPNEDLSLLVLYSNEIGDVSFQWTSEPSDGIDFLNDVTIENPTFNFPINELEYEGTNYIFTVVVMDDECQSSQSIELEVLPIIPVTFDFEDDPICQNEEIFFLPNTSLEGISGTWNIPSIDPNDFPDRKVIVYFTTSASDVDCPTEFPFEIEIIEYVIPTFDFPLEFCKSDSDEFEFPDSSLEDVDGEWNLAFLTPSLWPIGTIDLIFSADDPFCIEPIEITIEVIGGEELNFHLPNEFCAGGEGFVFPEISDFGWPGTWTYPNLDTFDSPGFYTNIFTVSSMGCFKNYTHDFQISDNVNVTFNIPSLICRNGELVVLDSVTTEGIAGIWSISTFDLDTIQTSFISSTWTSLDPTDKCNKDTTVVIEIRDVALPFFNLPAELCIKDTAFVFPLATLDSMHFGSWTMPVIDPSELGLGSVVSTFIPDSLSCVDTLEWTIEIIELGYPVFSFPTQYCELHEVIDLPLLSDDGISGSWNVNAVDPALVGVGQVTVFFTPFINEECISDLELNITIVEAVTPAFDLEDYLCWTDENFIFPIVSNNNIYGTWSTSNIEIDDYLNENLISTFVPEDSSCALTYEQSIFIFGPFALNFFTEGPSGCNEKDGFIQINGSVSDLEFSIDFGMTWTDLARFDFLESGIYTVLVKAKNFVRCSEQFTFELNAPDTPIITSVNVINNSNCTVDIGSIFINATGSNLNYSIDEGSNWQTDNTFNNLPSGNYIVMVAESGNLDCSSSYSVIIDNPIPSSIVVIEAEGVSDCDVEDGSIVIFAEGQGLEFSINGGSDWFSFGEFHNLSNGEYLVVVRSTIYDDCIDSQLVVIETPEVPIILDVFVTSPTTCSPNIGAIEIIASGLDLEYSIDNGQNWQNDHLFNQLEEGNYIVVIREQAFNKCYKAVEVNLTVEFEQAEEPILNLSHVSDCNFNDGSVEVLNFSTDYEFSIDGGIEWQAENLFSDLSPDIYTIFVRLSISPECISSITFEINDADCDCSELSLEFEVVPITCDQENSGRVEILDITGLQNSEVSVVWNNGVEGLALEDVSQGWYYVSIDYDNNCEWQDSVFVNEIDTISFALQSYNANCSDSEDGIIEIFDVNGGNGFYQYSINGMEYQSDQIFFNLSPDDYVVYVLDGLDCIASKIAEVDIDELPDLELPAFVTIDLGDTLVLNPLINETTIDSFSWLPNEGILNPGELIAKISPNMTYEYTLTIYFGECLETRTIKVEVIDKLQLFMANVFSPNDISGNARFYIQSKPRNDIVVNSFQIYDRWGNLVFEKLNPSLNEPSDGWDGYFNGSKVNPGVFVYNIDFLSGQLRRSLIGTITIIN